MRARTFSHHTCTIPNGASASNAINVQAEAIAVIFTPAAWTAAVLAFEISLDNGTTWVPVVDDGGTEVSIASAQMSVASRAMVNATILGKLQGLSPLVRLQSGPVGARVAQGAARVIEVITKTL